MTKKINLQTAAQKMGNMFSTASVRSAFGYKVVIAMTNGQIPEEWQHAVYNDYGLKIASIRDLGNQWENLRTCKSARAAASLLNYSGKGSEKSAIEVAIVLQYAVELLQASSAKTPKKWVSDMPQWAIAKPKKTKKKKKKDAPAADTPTAAAADTAAVTIDDAINIISAAAAANEITPSQLQQLQNIMESMTVTA